MLDLLLLCVIHMASVPKEAPGVGKQLDVIIKAIQCRRQMIEYKATIIAQ
jgi:hypothetical protein